MVKLSIASGHSMSIAILQYDSGKFACAAGKSLNHHYVKEAKVPLLDMLNELRKHSAFSSEDVEKVALTLPGVSHFEDVLAGKKLLEELGLPTIKEKAVVLDDTLSALVAGAGTFKGVGVVAGTGASAVNAYPLHALTETISYPLKKDGLGPLLGDHGSGFKLGVEFLSWYFRERQLEGDIPQELLEELAASGEEVFVKPQVAQLWFDKMIERAGHSKDSTDHKKEKNGNAIHEDHVSPSKAWNMRFSSIAQVVTDYVDKEGAAEAVRDLVDNAALDIFNTICAANRHTPPGIAPSVYCYGGMFANSIRYWEQIKGYFRETFEAGTIQRVPYHTSVGGLLMCQTDSWTEPTRDALNELVSRLPKDVLKMVSIKLKATDQAK